jgi:NAD(P)-dependent dehydrogenase (short-subunit alcohol dehydrogenase family)
VLVAAFSERRVRDAARLAASARPRDVDHDPHDPRGQRRAAFEAVEALQDAEPRLLHLRGSFLCAREAIQHFLGEEKTGSIVNVSSVHQLIPKPGCLGYSTGKGGMQNLTRTLALEYAGHRLRRPETLARRGKRACRSGRHGE